MQCEQRLTTPLRDTNAAVGASTVE